MTSGMEFCLLGPLTVRAEGVAMPIPAGKQRALLTALLLNAGRTVTADQLADLLWSPALPPSAAITLQNYVKRLRQALGAGRYRIMTQPGGYLIQVHPGELDLSAMEEALTTAHRAAQAGAWTVACERAVAALAFWRGEPFCDVDLGEMAVQEIPRLTEMRFRARELRIEASLHLGGHSQLVAEGLQLTLDAPLREPVHALLMQALYRCGRRAEALEAYQHARDVLIEELGSEPGPELQALHRQILDDDPILIPAPPPASPWGGGQEVLGPREPAPAQVVPRGLPAPPKHFAGRAAELAALTRLLDQDGSGGHLTVVISAIGGTAGVGKTALALRWAHQVAGRFPDGQLYVNLRGFDPALPPLGAGQAIRWFLDALEVPAARIPADLEAQASLYRGVLAGKQVLIVADNAADAAQVRPLLPGSPSCLVIVTSRNQLTGLVATDGAVPLSLDVLTNAEARDMLCRVLGDGRVGAEPEVAGQLIEACGRLPLALAITAARAATRPLMPLAAVAAKLADATRRLDALNLTDDPLASIRSALACSYRHLGADAARMFRLLGLHPGPDISVPAAASLASLPGPQADRLLAELADASLISQDAAGRYSLHDLVRLHAAEQAGLIDSDSEREAVTCRMLDHYLHTGIAAALLLKPGRTPIDVDPAGPGTAPEHLADHRAAMSWFEAEHRVLIAAAGHAFTAGQDTRAWNIAWTLHHYFYYRGHWHDQMAMQTAALAAASRLGDLTLQAKSHDYLANTATWLSRYDDADSHFRQALDMYRQLGDQIQQASVHFSLSAMLSHQGQPARATVSARHALELYTAAGHELGQANALNGLGWHLCQLGDYEQALVQCEQALALSRKAGGRSIESAALDSLGYAHHHLGQHSEAIACYQQALDICSGTGNRYPQADSLSHLGDTHQATGNLQAARTAWREALAIFDDLQHPDAEHVRAKLSTAEAPAGTPEPGQHG